MPAKRKYEYEKMLPFCKTPRQTEIVEALIETDNISKVARNKGIAQTNIYRMINPIDNAMQDAGKGLHYVRDLHIPEGVLQMRGTTTRMDRDKVTGEMVIGQQYIKTERNKSIEGQYTAFMELLNEETAHLHRHYNKVKKPRVKNGAHIVNYKTTDLHFGALMWAEEVGHDYDLQKARDMLLSATRYLIDSAPATKKCIISDTGDMVEADDYSNTTKRSGNVLDVDGRYPKILDVVLDTFVDLTYMALEKHEEVTLIFTKGNHDDQTSHFVQTYLKGYFRNEKRVTIDATPTPRKYYLHGTTLLGFTHGHEMKPERCGEIMAKECKKVFHITVHRYFSFGHEHKVRRGETVLCQWFVDRNLPPSNAWAHAMGFLGQLGSMSAVTYCKDHGLIDEQTFSASRLQGTDDYEFESKSLMGQLS